MRTKLQRLEEILRKAGKAAVAFSGGTDSAFLLSVAQEVLGRKVMAFIIQSALIPEEELREAEAFCAERGLDYSVLFADPFRIEGFSDNPPDRCYLCKREMFSMLRRAAENFGFSYVADGTNAEDTKAYRPGMRALSELGIASPLRDVELTKAEIRALSKERGLPTWNKAASPCLATRFPYGECLTKDKTERVAAAEAFLKAQGFSDLRVRSHGDLARIEIPRTSFEQLFGSQQVDDITTALKDFGFSYVTLDLQGFRSGSFDEGRPKEEADE